MLLPIIYLYILLLPSNTIPLPNNGWLRVDLTNYKIGDLEVQYSVLPNLRRVNTKTMVWTAKFLEMHEENNSLQGNGNRATFSLLVSLKEMNAYFLGKRNLVTHYQVRDNMSARVRLQNRGLRVQ